MRDSYVVEWSLLRKAGWTGQVSGSRPVLNSKVKVQRAGLEVTIEHPIDSYATEYHITPPYLCRPQDELNASTFQLGAMSEVTPLKLPSCACA